MEGTMSKYGDLFDKVAADTRFNPGGGPSIMQRKAELVWLLEIVRAQSEITAIVEFGSLFGGNLVAMSSILEDQGAIISVEPEFEGKLRTDLVEEYLGGKYKFVHMKDTTDREDLWEYIDPADDKIMIMIDSIHTKDAVLHDFSVATMILDYGGYIAIHDLVKSGVAEAWNNIKERCPTHLEFISEESEHSRATSGDDGWGGIGVVRFDRKRCN
jgi:cephalosporin hydroxylase